MQQQWRGQTFNKGHQLRTRRSTTRCLLFTRLCHNHQIHLSYHHNWTRDQSHQPWVPGLKSQNNTSPGACEELLMELIIQRYSTSCYKKKNDRRNSGGTLRQRYLKDIPKTSQRYPKDISKISQRYLKDILKISQKYPKDIPKISKRYPKDIPKISQIYPKDI